MTVEPRGETLVVRPPAPLAEGAYLLSYRVTSVDATRSGPRCASGSASTRRRRKAEPRPSRAARWAGLLARWLVYVTALGAAGLALFVQVVRPPEPVAGRTRRLLGWTGGRPGSRPCCSGSGMAGLELAGLPPAALVSGAPWAAVAGTTLAWATAVAVLGLALLSSPPVAAAAGCALPAPLVVAGSFALTGHAASAEPRWLAGRRSLLHTLVRRVLAGLARPAALVPAARRRRGARGAAPVLGRGHGRGRRARGRGRRLAWVQLGGELRAAVGAPPTASASLGKLALVAGLLALAAVNRFVLTPRVVRDARRPAIARAGASPPTSRLASACSQ